MFSPYFESEDDLETFMRSMTIAARQNKELRFFDLFLFEYAKEYDILDACYKSLRYLNLLETEGDIING